MNKKSFFVLNDMRCNVMPDEERLMKVCNWSRANDSLRYTNLPFADFIKLKSDSVVLKYNSLLPIQNENVIYFSSRYRKPFLFTNIANNDLIYFLDSNIVSDGIYFVNFHWHYSEKIYKLFFKI